MTDRELRELLVALDVAKIRRTLIVSGLMLVVVIGAWVFGP